MQLRLNLKSVKNIVITNYNMYNLQEHINYIFTKSTLCTIKKVIHTKLVLHSLFLA